MGPLRVNSREFCLLKVLAKKMTTKKFKYQLERVPEWVRKALGIHWVIVKEDESVEIIPPTEQFKST